MWILLGVVAVLLVSEELVRRWRKRAVKVRDPYAYQDWGAEERQMRVATFKAPAKKGSPAFKHGRAS